MSNQSANNKRIAKNTLLLYIRLFLLMGVSFYMSRVVLQILGIEDLGIYNVVGGIVTMMSFMNNSLNITTQRFMNYEMGKGRLENLSKVFSMSFWSYMIIAVIVLLVCETIGLWFFYNYLNIPENRIDAAFWVYQFSVVSFIVNLLTVPYSSTIIAHERMGIYAYISIGDAILKLLLVFALNYINYDKLWLYGFMMLLATLFIWLCNWIYCRIQFEECRLRLMWSPEYLKKIMSFTGWTTLGNVGSCINIQGVNVLINVFFSPSLNGARAIAFQVRTAITSFSANFLMAVRPQIFKSYAEGNLAYATKLITSSTKLSIYILLLFLFPLFLNTEFVLTLWLGEISKDMVVFTQIVLIGIPINICIPNLENVAQASGYIKKYQIISAFSFIMIPVCTYLMFKLGFRAEWGFLMAIIWDIIGIILRLIVLKKDVGFSLFNYFTKVIMPVFLVLVITILFISPIFLLDVNKWLFLILSVLVIDLVLLFVIWILGLESSERNLVMMYISKRKL